MAGISLIVRGDDFGLCHAANQAIWESFETGVLSCASLTVAGPWVAEAAGLAREHPEWEIGLQLVLTCDGSGCRWGPVAGAAAVPSLVGPTGTFLPQLPPSIDADEVAREFEAQVERARAWGLTPAFLECGTLLHPAVESALRDLSSRLGIPTGMLGWGIRPLPLPEKATPAPAEAVSETLKALTAGVYLWVVRPAQDSPETWGLWADENVARTRHDDLHALCASEVAGVIEERGIELISFRQHLEARLGTEPEE